MTAKTATNVTGVEGSPVSYGSMITKTGNLHNTSQDVEDIGFRALGGDLIVAFDGEWQKHRNNALSLQLSVVGESQTDLVIWYPLAIEAVGWEVLAAETRRNGAVPIAYESMGCLPLIWILKRAVGLKRLTLRMFYSPTDLLLLMGKGSLSVLGNRGWLNQKRRITIRRNERSNGALLGSDGNWYQNKKETKGKTSESYTVIVDDLKGNSPGSLAAIAEAVGVKMSKVIIDPTTNKPVPKENMLRALQSNTPEFVRYAVDDARKLHEIRAAFNSKVRELMRETVGVALEDKDIKGTNGSLVAHTFEKWLMGLDPLIPFAVNRLARTSRNITGEQRDRQNQLMDYVEGLFQGVGARNLLSDPDDETYEALQKYLKVRLDISGLQECSSATLGKEGFAGDSLAYSALVQGGRAVNEAPHTYLLEMGADIDLSGCYGNALRHFDYPLGRPSTLSYFQRETKRKTLGVFMRTTEKYLVPGLWQIVVTGKLPFDQDLIFSKKSTLKKIAKACGVQGEEAENHEDQGDQAQIPGEFALLRRQIENGIITAKVWDALNAVATRDEMAQIKSLKIESAVWFDSRHRVDTVAEWCEKVLETRGQRTKQHGDRRPKAWTSVSIGDFMGPLLDLRKAKKGAMKESEGAEYDALNAEQTLLKLFINTLYGCLASPYFRISNAVVANNITAAARVGAWQMAKALGSVQSITDGGSHPLREVRFLAPNARKPGLAVLSDYQGWYDTKKGRTLGSLANLNWENGAWEALKSRPEKRAEKILNRLGLSHIRKFWAFYGLSFDFDVEYKGENTFERFAYWNKTDYGMVRVQFADAKPKKPKWFENSDGEKADVSAMGFKVRGERFKLDKSETVAPKLELLINILTGSQKVPSKTEWIQTRLKTITEWSKEQYNPDADLLPGDEVVMIRGLTGSPLYRNHNQPAQTFKQLEKREKRKVGFEKHSDKGIVEMHRRMRQDKI